MPKLSCVGIGERKAEPAFRHEPLQLCSLFQSGLAALLLLPVVFAVNPLNLTFPRTVFTGVHGGFAPCGVERELVAGYLAFTAADATTPPVGVAGFGASFR